MKIAFAFALGCVFALGLVISGMSAPQNVLAFLDVTSGHWDPTLMFVMGPAIAVSALVVRVANKRKRPVLAPKFVLPKKNGIDVRLVAGAALFGIGWGISGICPGPGVVGAATLQRPFLVFFVAVAAGMLVFRVLERALADKDAPVDG
jgi:uncharacterized membrane protein YedE/YeeE